jgi:hypothetical protein
VEGFWSAKQEVAVTNRTTTLNGRRGLGPQQADAMATRTITLDDSEYGDVTAALELLINHCDAFNGPANPFAARRENCEALLKKLRAASLGPRVH